MSSNEIKSLLINFSNKRRTNVENQNRNVEVLRKNSLGEQYLFNFVPVALASTILSPLNRIKTILQIESMYIKSDPLLKTPRGIVKKIIEEQGKLALWKGNLVYTTKIFLQLSSRIIIYDRLKNWEQTYYNFFDTLTFKIPGAFMGIKLIGMSLCSLCTVLLTYPFELASVRLMGDVNKKGELIYKEFRDIFFKSAVETTRASDGTGTESVEVQEGKTKHYYRGLNVAMISSIANGTVSLIGFQLIFKYQNRIVEEGDGILLRQWKLYGCLSLLSLISSLVTYPLDTLKKKIQVNGTYSYKNDFHSINGGIASMRRHIKSYWTAGLQMHILRSLPFSIIQYHIYSLITWKFLDPKKL